MHAVKLTAIENGFTMTNKAPTGEMKFGPEPTGLYIAHEDLKLYLSAMQAMQEGRRDAVCVATYAQLMDLMTQAADDETSGAVEVCKSFDECRMTTARLDALMRT